MPLQDANPTPSFGGFGAKVAASTFTSDQRRPSVSDWPKPASEGNSEERLQLSPQRSASRLCCRGRDRSYLSVRSAEKESGKTLLLEVLSLLVAGPWFTGRVTAAVLVRNVARDCPSLVVDETNAAFSGDKDYAEALRGILNSGYRRGGVVSLCVMAGSDYDL